MLAGAAVGQRLANRQKVIVGCGSGRAALRAAAPRLPLLLLPPVCLPRPPPAAGRSVRHKQRGVKLQGWAPM